MRDDAVLGRALPLDRGLGPIHVQTLLLPQQDKLSWFSNKCFVRYLLTAAVGDISSDRLERNHSLCMQCKSADAAG